MSVYLNNQGAGTFGGEVWGAGDDANDGQSPATPRLTASAAEAVASAGDDVFVVSGTYEGAVSVNVTTNWTAVDGKVTLALLTPGHLFTTFGSATVEFTGQWELSNQGGGTTGALRTNAGSNVVINDELTLSGTAYGVSPAANWTGEVSGSGVLRFNEIAGRPMSFPPNTPGTVNLATVLILDCDVNVRFQHPANVSIENLLIGGYGANHALNLNGYTGVLEVGNLIEIAHGSTSTEPFSGATESNFVVHNGYALPSSQNFLRDTFASGAEASGAVVGASGNTTYSPVFSQDRRAGSISIMIDDYANIGDWDLMCEDAVERGFRVSITTQSRPGPESSQDGFLEVDRQILRNRFAQGHDITSHGKTAFTATIENAFTVQYTGAGSATMSISNNTLTTDTGGQGVDLSIDLSSLARVVDLTDLIDGTAGYTADFYEALPVSARQIDPATIADISAQDISAAVYTAQFDLARLYADEFGTCISDLEEYVPGLQVTTHVWSTGAVNANSRQGCFDSGLDGGRGTNNTEFDLENGIPIYETNAIQADALLNASSDPRRFATALCEWVKWTGAIVNIYDHGFDVSTSRELWRDFMDACVATKVTVETYSEQVARIRSIAQPSGSGGETIYTLEWDDENWTPQLAQNSPASFISEWPYGSATSGGGGGSGGSGSGSGQLISSVFG